MRTEPKPEFSRLVPAERVGERELIEEIAASAEERAALARRFDLLALDELTATLRLRRVAGGAVRLDGRFSARVTQACVVTLQSVDSRLDETFSQLYMPGPAPEAPGEVVVEPEGEEPAEPIGPEGIDLGEAVAQQLAMALDPYPRVPGAELPEAAGGGEAAREPGDEGPFAVLKGLRRER